jgi:hypothetical protein
MPAPSAIPTVTLRKAFISLMDQTGRPLLRVDERQRSRGPAKEVYALPDGKTLRLRTNNMPALMVRVEDGSVDVPLPFENEDFVGIAFPAINKTDTVIGYLVPTAVAAEAIRTAHRKWLAAKKSRSRDNNTRVLKFSGDTDLPWLGYAKRWEEYCIGEIKIGDHPVAAAVNALDLEIANARRRIAAVAGKPESAIRISIDF